MTAQLRLMDLRREGPVATVVLASGEVRFEETYLWYEDRVVVSPRSSLNFTREEFALHAMMERIHRGETVDLPAEIVVPDDLPPAALRRWSFFDTEQGRALMERAHAVA